MLPQLDDGEFGDWSYVFNYASPDEAHGGVSKDSFTREDVVKIHYIEEGENDGADWIGVFELADGRFAALRASCDYTGWG